MREFQFNWAVTLAFGVLLIYTYISFLGALYVFQSTEYPVTYALGFAVLQIVVVSALIVLLCLAKMNRWKKIRIIGQVVGGIVVLISFLFSGAFFSRFLDASAKQSEITEQINIIKESAKNMKTAYRMYVNQRVSGYQSELIRNRHYNRNAELRLQSFQLHLLPQSLQECENERDNWLDDFEEMSVWNIRMPERLGVLSETVDEWLDEYVELSQFSYSSSPYNYFVYTEFNENLQELTDELMPEDIFENLHIRWWVCILAILALFIMLLPYFIAQELTNGNLSNKDSLYIDYKSRRYYYE